MSACASIVGRQPGAALSGAALAAGLFGSLVLLPVVMIQGRATRRRVPRLPPARPPHDGVAAGAGIPIRLVAIGESPVAGVGLARGEDAVAAATARALARRTGRPVAWRAEGLSGATARAAIIQLLPRIAPQPADILLIAFGVNDTIGYRAPASFADDIATLVAAARERIGAAAVIIAAVAPFTAIPAFPRALRIILGWRSAALQAAIERLPQRLPDTVVQTLSHPPAPDLFASDGFHPNAAAHELWGEQLAALAWPLVQRSAQRGCASPANLPS